MRIGRSSGRHSPRVSSDGNARETERVRQVEYVWPEEGADYALYAARCRFLEILDEECPEARVELRNAVWPKYKEMFRRIGSDSAEEKGGTGAPPPKATDSNWVELRESETFNAWLAQARGEGDSLVQDFTAALDAWLEKYKLNEAWVRDAVIRTIRAWEMNPDLAERPWWVMLAKGTRDALTVEEQAFTFSYPWAWEPTLKTREQAKAEITTAFTTKLIEWLNERAQLAENRNFRKVPVKKKLERDLRWLVLNRVKGLGFAEIARKHPKLKGGRKMKGRGKTVENAVKAAEELIGLTPRSS